MDTFSDNPSDTQSLYVLQEWVRHLQLIIKRQADAIEVLELMHQNDMEVARHCAEIAGVQLGWIKMLECRIAQLESEKQAQLINPSPWLN